MGRDDDPRRGLWVLTYIFTGSISDKQITNGCVYFVYWHMSEPKYTPTKMVSVGL